MNEYENTDIELWREIEDDYYAPSIHRTHDGGIGINVGGYVIVKPLREWHKLAIETAPIPPLNIWHTDGYLGPRCPKCGSDYPRDYWIFGERHCIHDKCEFSKEN